MLKPAKILLLIFVSSVAFAEPASLRQVISVKDFNPQRRLSAAEVREDLDAYSFAISHAYSGFRFAPEKGSRKLLDLYRSKAAEPQSSAELVDFLYRETLLVQDRHFRVANMVAQSERPPEPRPGKGVCPACDPKKSGWEFSWASSGSLLVPVISIHNFEPPGAVWNGLLDRIRALKSSSGLIVIDLRANGGGDDEMAGEIARLLLDTTETPTAYSETSLMQNRFSLEIFLNSLDLAIQHGHDYREPKRLFEEKLKGAEAGILLPEETSRWPEVSKPGPNAYSGKVYVLIDRNTGSSGESAADMLRMLPFVTLVGENTSGTLHFGNLGLFQLPHSKIVVEMGINFNRYRDGKFREIIGIDPQIRVPDGADALEYLISKLPHLE